MELTAASSPRRDTVERVARDGLCAQCGTCVAACPVRAVEMRETPSGMFLPRVDAARCNGCGLCVKLCPGLAFDLGLLGGADPFVGVIRAAFAARAADPALGCTGQSGGLVTALLLHLLESRQADAALVTVMPSDGSLRPEPLLARTRPEVLAAQGSKYSAVAGNRALNLLDAVERVAAVALPCALQGLHTLQQRGHTQASKVRFRIGLFCDRTLLRTCAEQMAADARLPRDSIAALEYRSKARAGWPGEVAFLLKDGRRAFFPPRLRLDLKEFFTPPRCRLCFDKSNVLADVAVGDPWGIPGKEGGHSVALARTELGERILRDAARAGYLELSDVSSDAVIAGQGFRERRRSLAGHLDAWRETGRPLPQYPGLDRNAIPAPDGALRRTCRRRLGWSMLTSEAATREDVFRAVAGLRKGQRLRRIAFAPLALWRRTRDWARRRFGGLSPTAQEGERRGL